jgi:hypothetical protein
VGNFCAIQFLDIEGKGASAKAPILGSVEGYPRKLTQAVQKNLSQPPLMGSDGFKTQLLNLGYALG